MSLSERKRSKKPDGIFSIIKKTSNLHSYKEHACHTKQKEPFFSDSFSLDEHSIELSNNFIEDWKGIYTFKEKNDS